MGLFTAKGTDPSGKPLEMREDAQRKVAVCRESRAASKDISKPPRWIEMAAILERPFFCVFNLLSWVGKNDRGIGSVPIPVEK